MYLTECHESLTLLILTVAILMAILVASAMSITLPTGVFKCRLHRPSPKVFCPRAANKQRWHAGPKLF